jgi:hypothetical protein
MRVDEGRMSRARAMLKRKARSAGKGDDAGPEEEAGVRHWLKITAVAVPLV